MTADPFSLLVAFLAGWLANSLIVGLIFGGCYLAFKPRRPSPEREP